MRVYVQYADYNTIRFKYCKHLYFAVSYFGDIHVNKEREYILNFGDIHG